MENPWEGIPLSDYENHMSLSSVMQLQAMNDIMEGQLSRYPARTVMLLGAAGGNGLEHIDPAKVQTLYGVDINRDYLAACAKRYPQLRDTLVCIQADLTSPGLDLPHAGLVLANLLVEYIGCQCFQNVIAAVQPEYVSCVIQRDTGPGFVSASPYLHVFDGLEAIHHPITEEGLAGALAGCGFRLAETEARQLPNGKKLVRLDFEGGRPF